MRSRKVLLAGIVLGSVLIAGGATAWAFAADSVRPATHAVARGLASPRAIAPTPPSDPGAPNAVPTPSITPTPIATTGAAAHVEAEAPPPKSVPSSTPAAPAPQPVESPLPQTPPMINPAPPVDVAGAFGRELATTPGALPYGTGEACYRANYGQITDTSTFSYNSAADRGIVGLVHRLSVTYSDTHLVGSSELNFYNVQWYVCAA